MLKISVYIQIINKFTKIYVRINLEIPIYAYNLFLFFAYPVYINFINVCIYISKVMKYHKNNWFNYWKQFSSSDYLINIF